MAEYYYDYATETMEKKEDEISQETNIKVDDEIVEAVLKTFYKHTKIEFISSDLHQELKKYIVKQFKTLHCCNIRAKHVNDNNSKLSKILKKYDIVLESMNTFSIVGTYEMVQFAAGSAPLRMVFSKPIAKPRLYTPKRAKVPVGWYNYT